MATYTWVDLDIPEGALLADLNGVFIDLQKARDLAKVLKNELQSERKKWEIIEPYSIAIAVIYSRSFVTGVRARLTEVDLSKMNAEQRSAHDRLRAYRDKHVAHSVNALEENVPRANFCVDRVQVEGITSISCSHGRVAGLSIADLDNLIELATLMIGHVEQLMSEEKAKLLSIVKAMPLESVLARGRKGFAVDHNTRLDKTRKK